MKADEILVLWEIPLSDSPSSASDKGKHDGSASEETGCKKPQPALLKARRSLRHPQA